MDERLHEGMNVYSKDGKKLGKVTRLDAGGFLVEKGFFFPREQGIAYDELADVEGDTAWLRSTSDVLGTLRETRTTGGSTSTAIPGQREEIRVPVAEEELEVNRKEREAGQVRVTKQVTTENRQVTVPVTREEVKVERIPAAAGRPASADEARFENGTFTVPLREEEVEISKRPVVKEEVRIGKQAIQEEKTFDANLRKEHVEVEEEGAEGGRAPKYDEPAIHAGTTIVEEEKKKF